jgi:predicted N-acetyltransferase YhbS
MPTLRALSPADYPQALDLWDIAFTPGRGYFERYFDTDPWYREGDCFGAFEGERLVSAVHVCRRPVDWAGRTLWCGAIANVATHPDFRRQGLSRDLLRLAIQHMARDEMAFSMLFTGQFGHYGALGWEQVHTPQRVMRFGDGFQALQYSAIEDGIQKEAAVFGEGAELYWKAPPRPLLLHRPERYFRGWVEWNWRQRGARLLWEADTGYAVVVLPEGHDRHPRVSEWAAMNADGERALFGRAAELVFKAGFSTLKLENRPGYLSDVELAALGDISLETEPHMMLRRISLPEPEYAEVKRLYAAGDAAWWPADGF